MCCLQSFGKFVRPAHYSLPGADAIVSGDVAVAGKRVFLVMALHWMGVMDEIGHAAGITPIADDADVVVVKNDDVAALPLLRRSYPW